MTIIFPIHITSLHQVRELDVSTYDGIITIEDTTISEPFRVQSDEPKQLILRFDDISAPVDDWVEPSEQHVNRALKFGEKVGSGSLLIHCHWGISRSSGIALALIAKGLGKGRELEAVKTLERINPYCRPNALLVYLTDEILGRGGALFKATSSRVNLTGSMKPSFDY